MTTSRPKPATGTPPTTAPTPEFSTYPLPKLLALWKQGELTETQMVGHLLQHQFDHDKRLLALEGAARTAPVSHK